MTSQSTFSSMLYDLVYITLIGFLLLQCNANYVCTNVTYDEFGQPDVTATLYNCAANMQDPVLPISYLSGRYNDTALEVKSQFVLNNLIAVDELENTATLDFYYRNYWNDSRWNIPELWDAMDSGTTKEGFEIFYLTQLIPPLRVWLPDVEFQDVVDYTIVAQTIKLHPGGHLYWSRHFKVKLMQPNFDYSKYPIDSQDIVIRITSYGMSNNFCTLGFKQPVVNYINDADDKVSFKQNPVWYHDKNNYESEIYALDLTIEQSYPRFFDVGVVRIHIKREGDGILVRFALPILILILLAGVTFWAEYDVRTGATMTLLLSVSALYVVIIGNIPLLGYLTDFDRWILCMFVMLSICVGVHQTICRMLLKQDRWPARILIVRVFEMLGRVAIIPASIIIYFVFFQSGKTATWSFPALILTCIVFIFVFMRECMGVMKAMRVTLDKLQSKVDSSKEHRFTHFEMLLFNILKYGRVEYALPVDRMRKNCDNSVEMTSLKTFAIAGSSTLHQRRIDQDENTNPMSNDPYA